MTTRVYKITDLDTDERRLVEASTSAQSIRHVVGKRFVTDVATQRDLIELVGQGVEVEIAGAE